MYNFMLCVRRLSLRPSLLRYLFIKTNFKSLSDRLVTALRWTPRVVVTFTSKLVPLKPCPFIVVWAEPCFNVVLVTHGWCT